MSNKTEIEKYLIGDEKAFLFDNKNNGKILMLSGVWGSGKTHFYKNIIQTKLNDKEKPNIYVSLYGKTSIEEIQNEVFIKAYYLSLGIFEKDRHKEKDIIENIFATFSPILKGFNLSSDVGKFKFQYIIEAIEKLNKDSKDKKVEEFLQDGVIICFDDFERKSSKVDLNDIFGFITNLSIEFKCKVVIILNSESFSEEDSKVFERVKEKSVNKFLKFQPSQEELFNILIDDEKYNNLSEKRDSILEIIKLTNELNARIYIQVLDNVSEYLDKREDISEELLKILVLNTMFFSKYHKAISLKNINEYENSSELVKDYLYETPKDYDKVDSDVKSKKLFATDAVNISLILNTNILNELPLSDKTKIYFKDSISSAINVNEFISNLDKSIEDIKEYSTRERERDLKILTGDNKNLIYDTFIYICKYKIFSEVSILTVDILEINNFIETGIILPKESNG